MKALKLLRWTAINGAIFACLFFGLSGRSDGALNVGLFFTWITIVLSFFLLSGKLVALMKNDFGAPQWLDVTFDILVLALLSFYGYTFTASMYLVHIFIINNARNTIAARVSAT